VTGTKDLEEGEVSAVLDLAIFVTVIKLDVLDAGFVEVFLTWPFKSFSPGLVSEPVTDEVGITSIDQDWDLLENAWHKTMEWLHPVALEEEISVDVEITAVVAADLNAELLLDLLLVEIFADISKGRIAEIAGVLALAADIIDVLTSSLVRTDECVVAINACRNTRPDTFAIVAVLDQALAAGESVIHSLTFAFVENSRVPALSTCHWSVVFILGKSISKTITDQN